MHTSCPANAFLDWANHEVFIPNGLYAVVLQFKDEVPGEQQGALGMLSQKLGKTLFTTEKIDINRPVSAHPSPTTTEVELPQIAHLVYPDLFSRPTQTVSGRRTKSESMQGKLKSAGTRLQDNMEKKAQPSNVSTLSFHAHSYFQHCSCRLGTQGFRMLPSCPWVK
jgi:hypothetical protein